MEVKRTLLLAVLQSAVIGVLSAQTTPHATTSSTFYVGAQPTTINPDWGCATSSPFGCWNRQLFGVEAYAGLNQVWNRFGLEADARFLNWRGVNLPSGQLKENSFLAGPTVHLYTRRKLTAGANFLIGIGSITLPKGFGPGQGNYLIYSPSFHVEQRITERINVRYEYEYQLWPGFSGAKGNNGLNPNGFGVGITYKIRPRY